MMQRISDSIRKQIVSEYLMGMTAESVSKMYNISVKSVYNILKDKNINYRHGTRQYFPNQDVFASYTQASCYWAGFIAADGSVNKNTISINLQKKDYSHLEKLNNFIETKYPISNCKGDTVKLSICSKKMVYDLFNNFNIYSNKTFTISMPALPNCMIPHYIRGYFDGDGSICFSKGLIQFNIVSGSKQQICDIEKYLRNSSNIKCSMYKYNNKNLYAISKRGSGAIKIFNILYENSTEDIFLNRKRYRFLKYLDNIEDIKFDRIIKKYKQIFSPKNLIIYNLKKSGHSVTKISKMFNMCESNCYFILQKIREFRCI